jgi:penicillin-binding protein 2
LLAALVVAMFATLTTRLWFLQVLAAEQYRDDARQNAVRLIEVPAPRGVIKDADGVKLVENRPSIVITINRQELGDETERVLLDLSQLLQVPADELGSRLDDPRYYVFSPIPVAINVPRRVAYFIKEHHTEFPGVDVVEVPVRKYPFGSLGAHALGYLGQISKEELADPGFSDYEAGDLIGVSGVESVYERDLAGTRGLVKYRVNSAGENLGPIGERHPVAGNDVWLTLDADTQALAEDSLQAGIEHARTIYESESQKSLVANAGAAVVLDPDTGAIEAMASFPSFDPALFTRSISIREFGRRFGQARGLPLLNRAIQGQYPPGSTYKPFIAASALQRDIVSTGQSYGCPPVWIAPYDESDPEAVQYVFNNWTTANLGYMNLAGALARSCDTIFYPMGYRYWDLFYVNADEAAHGVVSHEPLQHDLEAFGFDAPTRVDLPFEEDGRVPDAEWKRSIHKQLPDSFPEGEWFPGDFILMTIGQGDTLVTPLQLATAYAAFQNDGKLCVPHVFDRVVDGDEVVRRYHPNCRRKVGIDERNLRYVRDALTGTVKGNGTAGAAFAGFPFGTVWVAGKTGTAEVPPKQDYSWFAAMTAGLGQEHVVVVLVEQGGHGATTAAPIARHIIEGMYGLEFSQFTDIAGTD